MVAADALQLELEIEGKKLSSKIEIWFHEKVEKCIAIYRKGSMMSCPTSVSSNSTNVSSNGKSFFHGNDRMMRTTISVKLGI